MTKIESTIVVVVVVLVHLFAIGLLPRDCKSYGGKSCYNKTCFRQGACSVGCYCLQVDGPNQRGVCTPYPGE